MSSTIIEVWKGCREGILMGDREVFLGKVNIYKGQNSTEYIFKILLVLFSGS